MKLNIDYEELKKAINDYESNLNKNKVICNQFKKYTDEGNELPFNYNFSPYRGKNNKQDKEITKIEDIFYNTIYNSANSTSGTNSVVSKYLEEGKKSGIRGKDCNRFKRYYESLLNNVKNNDQEKDGSYDVGSLKSQLKANLIAGNLAAASKNYRSLMRLYGKKKATSILNKIKKETGAKVAITSKISKVKNEKGKVERTYKKYSIVKDKATKKKKKTGAKKEEKLHTKTRKKKKK